MTKELRDSIEKIRALAPKLNAATDAAQAIVTRVEAFLNDECSIGIPAEVGACFRRDFLTADAVEDSDGNAEDASAPYERWWHLCYERVDGKFRAMGRQSGLRIRGPRVSFQW